MDPTSVIAIYAALVATAGLLVQYSHWRGSRTRLKVEAHAGVAPIVSGEVDGLGTEIHKPDEVLFIQLTNRSPHAIKITHVGVIAEGGQENKGLALARPYPLFIRLPIEIPARDNVTLWQPRTDLEAWEDRRMQVVIRTAAGDDFESASFRLGDLPRLEIVGAVTQNALTEEREEL